MEKFKPTEIQKIIGKELGFDPSFPDMHVMICKARQCGSMIHLSEIGEVTKEQMESMKSIPPNSTLKFVHWSTEKDEK
jgi:hypothetical protein